MPFISVRYLTFPTIEEVFPLPALLTTKQLSSSETIERLCCLSNGYFKQWSKNSLCVSSKEFITASLCCSTILLIFPKSRIRFEIATDGVILKASSLLKIWYIMICEILFLRCRDYLT